MRDFTKVSPSIWQSERFASLATDDARLTYLYLLTSPHMTSAGACYLRNEYAAADLRWPVDRYQAARAELEKAEMVLFDAANSVIMLRKWFRHNAPMNASHLKGIRHSLESLPSQQVRAEAVAELETLLPPATAEPEPSSAKTGGNKPWQGWKPRPK